MQVGFSPALLVNGRRRWVGIILWDLYSFLKSFMHFKVFCCSSLSYAQNEIISQRNISRSKQRPTVTLLWNTHVMVWTCPLQRSYSNSACSGEQLRVRQKIEWRRDLKASSVPCKRSQAVRPALRDFLPPHSSLQKMQQHDSISGRESSSQRPPTCRWV